jgi:uncharacterized protein (TIGR02246 family)
MLRLHKCFLGLLLAACVLFVLSRPVAYGQKADARAQDEAALRQASKEYLAAIQRNDRKAMAEFWVPAGIYVDEDGQSFKAREMIETAADSKDATRPQPKLTATTVRFLTADSAIEDGTSESTPAGKSSAVKGRFSAVWVRQNGKWKLDSLREFRLGTPPGPERLSGLEPFLGEWSGQSGNSTMHVTAKWNPGKTFMRRDISIASNGKVSFTATQQVGWDPIRQQIRSWVFDGDGGYGEGWWSLEGTMWMVLAQGVHANGKTSKATHAFKFIDRNTIVWKSMDASVDGQPSVDFEMTLTRGDKPKAAQSSPAAPATASTDAAKKATLLASDAWKRVEAEYQQWVSVQVIYTPQQMEETKAKFKAEVEKMSAAELQQFIAELDAKLKSLLTKDAMEARAWLGQYLSVFTDGYRKKFIGDIPNFADMTSAQMEQEYLKLKAKIMKRKREQASFDTTRTQMVDQAIKQDAAEFAAANQAASAANRGGGDTLYQSQYNPRPASHQPPPQMQFTQHIGTLQYTLPGSSY